MYEDSFFKEFILTVSIVLIIIIIIISIPEYFSSCVEANIYNQINNSHYTCGDFFWAEDQINQQTQTIKLIK